MMRGPLSGLRILAVEQFGAGPFGTMYLADLGAEVIKVEDPIAGGDVGRYIPPGQVGTDSLYFETFNRGKRSIAIDLKQAAGRSVFERLVTTADVVFSNLRGDQPDRLGLTYSALEHVNPRIVCVALTGYGRSGPRAELPSYDALIQAEAGWASITGAPDDPPTKSGLSLADYVGGLAAMVGLLAAVMDARGVGVGRDVDVNLYDSALAILSYPATWYLSRGIRTERTSMSAHPSIVPFQFFATLDGHVALACPKEKFFRDLIVALDLSERLGGPRYATFSDRLDLRQEVVDVIGARLRERSTTEWIAKLTGIVPIAPVRSVEEALSIAELKRHDLLVEYPHPTLGEVRSIGLPITMTGFAPTYQAAPLLDGDRLAILEALGYDAAARDDLAARGAFGTPAPVAAPAHGPGD
jgi:crotonobetainyl-CoA:carnitine CoA-transferase CaiB-like acyl-CoA transferase